MKRFLIALLPLSLMASQEAPKAEDTKGKNIGHATNKCPTNKRTNRALANLDKTVLASIKRLNLLTNELDSTKTINTAQIADANEWITDIELVSSFIIDAYVDAQENLEATKTWRSYFDHLAKSLNKKTENKEK